MATLTTAQRFEMMIERSNQLVQLLIRHGAIKPVEIVKRPCNEDDTPKIE
jgi:hypothetical protein